MRPPRPGLRTPLLVLALSLWPLAGCTDAADPLAPSELPEPSYLVVPVPGYVQVSAGSSHTCAIDDEGDVECWGNPADGRLDVPDGLANATQVSAGFNQTCAVHDDGNLTCWGANGSGQSSVPASLTDVSQVSAGFGFTCAVDGSGGVTCWGANTTGFYSVPDDLTDVALVAAGYQATCALKSDGTVRCWGDRTEPAGLTDVTHVSMGAYHSCASQGDGTVVCWGGNSFGATDVPDELQDPATADALYVSAGEYHNCVLRSDGTTTCWGNDLEGQASVPPGLGAVEQVSTGYYHTCARMGDGGLACWGLDNAGQANVPTMRVAPAAIFHHPSSVEPGESFTLSLMDAHVPGHAGATDFTYAFDCGDGSGYGVSTESDTASCAGGLGERTVRGMVTDQDGDMTEYTGTVAALYPFTGFFAPIRNDVVNEVRAGRAVPVKFSLGGDWGLDILEGGPPTFEGAPCTDSDAGDPLSETVTASQSGLSYGGGQYTYVWKTDKAWDGTCGTLTLAFVDGTTRSARFRFGK